MAKIYIPESEEIYNAIRDVLYDSNGSIIILKPGLAAQHNLQDLHQVTIDFNHAGKLIFWSMLQRLICITALSKLTNGPVSGVNFLKHPNKIFNK